MTLLENIEAIGLVPVIKIDEIEDALPLAKALIDGGLPVAEVTFRTSHAKEAMKRITKAYPEMLVGAGTVLTTTQVDDALEAGAKFIVSPGLNPIIVEYCQSKGVMILPGCSNASDIEMALSLGLTTVKFFPAESIGGLKTIKALMGPYTNVRFMPTGGISVSNIAEYTKESKIVACGGSWMVDEKLIKAKEFDKISMLAKEAILSMLGLELKHVAINSNPNDSKELATTFSELFGGTLRETSKGYFGSEFIEVMNAGVGTHGHIAIGTNSVIKARRYFEHLGYTFDEDTITYNANGIVNFIYLNNELGGFKVHLILK